MSESLPTIAGRAGHLDLPLRGFLRHLQRRGLLGPLLREAILEEVLLDQAQQAGLAVSVEELQRAADHFRRRQGLAGAGQTHDWLAQQGLSLPALEETLERDLLLEKVRDHLTRGRLEQHFAAHRAGYDRLRLRLIVVDRDDLARELLTQIREEGADFAELARRHSRHETAAAGGALGVLRRRQISVEVANQLAAVTPGAVVGPVATPKGFHLFLVENIEPAELDAATASLIREELVADWLNARLRREPITLPLLEHLCNC